LHDAYQIAFSRQAATFLAHLTSSHAALSPADRDRYQGQARLISRDFSARAAQQPSLETLRQLSDLHTGLTRLTRDIDATTSTRGGAPPRDGQSQPRLSWKGPAELAVPARQHASRPRHRPARQPAPPAATPAPPRRHRSLTSSPRPPPGQEGAAEPEPDVQPAPAQSTEEPMTVPSAAMRRRPNTRCRSSPPPPTNQWLTSTRNAYHRDFGRQQARFQARLAQAA